MTEEKDGYDSRTKRETWLEDSSPVEGIRNNDDGEDPHDLSFSSKHVPRASMVDSMVLSLDQFSSGSGSYSKYNDDLSSSSSRPPTKSTQRRGHTVSSSVSSENDVETSTPTAKPAARLNRRNSAAKYAKDTARLPSIFGEDEDPVRVRVYESQRAELPAKRVTRRRYEQNTKRGSKGSASSSLDLSHLAVHAGRLGPAGNRRSQSFDFGSQNRKDLRTSSLDPVDVAPTPVVFAGPKAQNSDISPAFNTAPIARKNSTRSSKSAYGRKARSGTLGTTAIRGKGDEIVPEMPISKLLSQPPTSFADSKQYFDGPQLPRPGFFRRVFGSSRNVTALSDASSAHNVNISVKQERDQHIPEEENRESTPTMKLQKPAGRPSIEVPTGKENAATLTKKSSTFFRRRKKSISANIPPPLPLTLSNNLRVDQVKSGEISPVSSLRAFMDPYLADGQHKHISSPFANEETRPDSSPAYHTAHSTPQMSETHFEGRDGQPDKASRNSRPKLQISNSKLGTMLRIPHQESFLADSSSTEEPTRKTRHETPSPNFDRPKTSPVNRSGTVPQNTGTPTSPLMSNSTPSYTRPSIPPRSESWQTKSSKVGSCNIAPNRPQKPLLSTGSHNKTDQDQAEEEARRSPSLSLPIEGAKLSPQVSSSDVSDYRSAPSTPLFLHPTGGDDTKPQSPVVHVSHPSISESRSRSDKEQAEKLFENRDESIEPADASAWLGDPGTDRERIRKEYMRLFDWTNMNILAAMRGLCDRIALKGETQQVDRMLDAFAQRWCECNPNNGFRSNDVVHTICYSILLLNTDLHLADIGQKMTRSQFVRNALPTIVRVAEDADAQDTIRGSSVSNHTPTPASEHYRRKTSFEEESAAAPNIGRSAEESAREEVGEVDAVSNLSGPLVEAPFVGTEKAWETQVEVVLKSFYAAISRQRLPLFGAAPDLGAQLQSSGNLLSTAGNMLRRTPSTLSKAPSDSFRGRAAMENKSIAGRWASKTRSRPRLAGAMGFGSSRTSLDDQSSGWSPSMSSTWSKASLGKTLTSMSIDSFGSESVRGDYQSSIGFANALSQAIIRDDQLEIPVDDLPKAGSLLEDESLGLCGAPWAKEGIVKHKCHLDGVDKRSKDRNWNDCFAVIEKGWVRLFSFSINAKSIRQKAKNQKAGAVVGGGNWQDNAEEVFKFMLRHTIASTLPPPGYSKARPFVWALSLPTGAVHLFSVGTPDIVKEFVSTANYWSARLSKEPLMGGVSNMEYGWSDNVINRCLLASDSHSLLQRGNPSPRPSTQMSVRSSMDHGSGTFRPKLPGDKATINDWNPPQQSMMASQLLEVDQLRNLQAYVKNVEDDLQKHNELRPAMLLAFSSRHPNSNRAMANWEKKSAYLLREIVKFRTYIDVLQNANATKQKIYDMRKQDEENKGNEDDSRALGAALGI
jgi:Sec7 domain/Pleckstrin homology domain